MFKIGDFSKFAQISARMLRHYDRIGLLSPDYTDPATGYRYYTAEQLPRLNRIIALKELGFSLEQITRLVNEDISVDEMRGMLLMKKAQVEQTLREEITRIRHIETRLQRIEQTASDDELEVVVKSIPAQYFLSLREIWPTMADARAVLGEMRRVLMPHINDRTIGQFVAIMHGDEFEMEDIDMEIGFLVNEPALKPIPLSSTRQLTPRELPAVATMGTAIRVGALECSHLAYGGIGLWAEANGYRMVGPAREVFIQLPGEGVEPIAEIQYPLERLNANPRLLA